MTVCGMTPSMNCVICGLRVRANNRRGICRRHGWSKSFDRVTGKCLRCGETIPARSRGSHAATKCQTVGPWNKGLTAEEDPRLVSPGRNATRPGVSAKIVAAWKDPTIRARYVEGISRGQRKRFSKESERAASRERTQLLILGGRIVAFGGRNHGNGKPPTDSEREMRHLLARHWFVAEHVVPTDSVPHHYKIDLANPRTRVAVELDGGSHSGTARRKLDARKDSFLKSHGWLVLRFRVGRQVEFDCVSAAQTCVEASKARVSSTT